MGNSEKSYRVVKGMGFGCSHDSHVLYICVRNGITPSPDPLSMLSGLERGIR
jgi:hypothetical protein